MTRRHIELQGTGSSTRFLQSLLLFDNANVGNASLDQSDRLEQPAETASNDHGLNRFRDRRAWLLLLCPVILAKGFLVVVHETVLLRADIPFQTLVSFFPILVSQGDGIEG